ncbi:MAG: aminotransferase class V-fold PLP-dependent enzyme [Microcystaceae cyanobacterium]
MNSDSHQVSSYEKFYERLRFGLTDYINNMANLSSLKNLWALDPSITFLNHGSFGACPTAVIEQQQCLRFEMERNPVEFLHRQLPERLEASRHKIADFLKINPNHLVFVPNATHGVNTVLQSIPWQEGDEVIVTNHGYRACRNALEKVAKQHYLNIKTVELPLIGINSDFVTQKVIDAVSPRTRLLMIDHITSATGLIFPIKAIAKELIPRDIEILVDGAHSAGSIPVNLSELGVTYYTTNAHKWLCAPKGAACLYVADHRISQVSPLCTSHAPSLAHSAQELFTLSFDWTGTYDPSAYLMIPFAIDYLASLVEGGWPVIWERNFQLAHQARDYLCHALAIVPPCSDEMFATLATLPIPVPIEQPIPEISALQKQLFNEWQIEIPVIPNPNIGCYMIRLSAFLYNNFEEYQKLGQALQAEIIN